MGLLDKRVEFKPFEYPELVDFTRLIWNTFWTDDEVVFTSDVNDYRTKLKPHEQQALRRAFLGIAQVEVGVKTFWGDIYKFFPKPEVQIMGSTFATNEGIHSISYSKLIEELGLNEEFKELLENPVFKKKQQLIENHLGSDRNIYQKLLFFTIVIENASLFSQFATALSFTKFKGIMKNISNIISWSSLDENLHATAGIYLINKLVEENYISQSDLEELVEQIRDYMDYEVELIDWMFEGGELEFFTKEDLLNFMKKRIDDSLVRMNLKPLYNITLDQYKAMSWYDEEVFSSESDDFFAKRPTAYTKHNQAFDGDSLF